MKNLPVVLLTCLITLVLASCGSEKIENPLNYQVGAFSFINQEGESYSSDDLAGKVWLANFIFTNCETVCPPMTAHMAKLQQMLKNENLAVEIVSFSVDPEVDSPEALKEFGSKFKADFTNWNFVTGYSQQEIEQFALESFATVAQKPKGEDQVIHGTYFYLIDKNGKVVKDYSGDNNTPYEEIIKHIKILQNQ